MKLRQSNGNLRIILTIVFSLLSINELFPQINIKERVEIAPIAKINKTKPASWILNSAAKDFPCFQCDFDPTSPYLTVWLSRPCSQVIYTTTLQSVNPNPMAALIGGSDVTNSTGSINVSSGTEIPCCGSWCTFGCEAYGYGYANPVYDVHSNVSMTTTTLDFQVNGQWWQANPFTVTIHLQAVPLNTGLADTCILNLGWPGMINAYYSNTLNTWPYIYDLNLNYIPFCGIEASSYKLDRLNNNPLGKVYLFNYDGVTVGAPVAGSSISVVEPADSHANLYWDGSDLVGDVDSVAITANLFGFQSNRAVVLLYKPKPDHFLVTSDRTMMLGGDSTNITVIAQDVNNNEVALDGNASITLYDGAELGYFSNPQVPYSVARSGTVKFFVEFNPSNTASEVIDPIVALRTDYPDRCGSCSIDVSLGCFHVALQDSTIVPGDSTQILLNQLRYDGTSIVPYSDDQQFNVWLGNGMSSYGFIRSEFTGATGSSLQNDWGPFYFIAKKSITADSVAVQISASLGDVVQKYPCYSVISNSMNPIINGAKTKNKNITNNSPVPSKKTIGALQQERIEKRKQMVDELFSKSRYAAFLSRSNVKNKDSLLTSQKATVLKLSEETEAQNGQSCSLPNATCMVVHSVPTNILLKANPLEVIHGQTTTLTVSLKDQNGKTISPNTKVITINFYSRETEQFGELTGNGQNGLNLTDVPYKQAYNGLVSFALNGVDSEGRFPIGISFYATSGTSLVSPTRSIMLKGANTLGEYYCQWQDYWAGQNYDKDEDTAKTRINGKTTYYHISAKGCAMSDVAMALKGFGCNVDPSMLNTWMDDPLNEGYGNHGNVQFETTVFGFPNSPVGASEAVGIGLLYRNGHMFPPPIAAFTDALDYNLNQGYPSIAQIISPDDGHEHWVLITSKIGNGQYTILDPGNPDRVFLDTSVIPIWKYREIIPK